MEKNMAHKLAELNNRFYRENARSFSGTRQSGWPGWDRALGKAAASCFTPGCSAVQSGLCRVGGMPRSVLDVACGNARFKAFLDERGEGAACEYHAIDACPDLLPPWLLSSFQRIDIIDALLCGRDLLCNVEAPACELVACFGFMHHVPTDAARRALMRFLVEKTTPGGYVLISFWRFANDDRLRAKAEETTKRGAAELGLHLDDGDYLLGWNSLAGVYRYCHSFSDGEIDYLAGSVADAAVVVDRFVADGKTGNMNGYLVLRRLS